MIDEFCYGKDQMSKDAGPVGRNKRSALRRKNNGATAIPNSELHLALMSEDGAMRFVYCALRTA
jgi:hypothetical protein